jgi:hypothetical protein
VAGLQKVNNDVKKLGDQMLDLSQKASRVATSLNFIGGAIVGGFGVAMRNAADYSSKVKNQLSEMNNVLIRLQIQIAEAVLPTLQEFTYLLARIVTWFNALDPAMRNMALNATLLAGAWALFGGIILKTGALLVRLVAVVAAANPVMIAIGLSIVAAAVAMNKFGVSIQDVINAVEIMVRFTVAHFALLYSKLADGVAFLLGMLEKVLAAIEFAWDQVGRLWGKAPDPENWGVVKGLRAARESVDAFSASLESLRIGNLDKIGRMMNGEDGIVVEKTFKRSPDDLSKQFSSLTASVQKQFNYIQEFAKQTAMSLQTSFSTFFFDAFTGEMKSAKEYVADFGRSVLQIISQLIAKWLILKTIGSIGVGGGSTIGSLLTMHSGGAVRKAHSGYMASDEVPIIAQAGEGIISKRGMQSLGASGLAGLNAGAGGGGGVTININPVIQAWDASDVYRNRQMITSVISESIKSNSEVRKIMKAYV